MDLLEADALRAFGVFATHRNFTTAAAALHISQPALHVKIRKLAAALDTDLYERDGRRLRLTASGERLAAFAEDSRRRLDDFVTDLRDGPPTLGIAAGRGALRWVIGPAVRAICAAGRRVHVVTADRDDALSALGSCAVEVAVVAHDPPPRRFEHVQVTSYPQVLLVDAESPLAARPQVRLADLSGLDLVVPPAGRPHRKSLDRALLDAGVSWQVSAEVDGWDLLAHLASLGLGATLVNGCVPAPDGMVAVPVADLPAVRYWAVWRPRTAGLDDVLERLRG